MGAGYTCLSRCCTHGLHQAHIATQGAAWSFGAALLCFMGDDLWTTQTWATRRPWGTGTVGQGGLLPGGHTIYTIRLCCDELLMLLADGESVQGAICKGE
jgi:hypothetical protein